MRDDDELHADAAAEIPPSFLGTIDTDSVRLVFSQERFAALVENARAARSVRRLAEEDHKRSAEQLQDARTNEEYLMATLKEIVRSHVGYEPFE